MTELLFLKAVTEGAAYLTLGLLLHGASRVMCYRLREGAFPVENILLTALTLVGLSVGTVGFIFLDLVRFEFLPDRVVRFALFMVFMFSALASAMLDYWLGKVTTKDK